ncbi:PTS glucose transporter subunit IIA [Enterobacteriaceae endosymbiont of Macroplea appendiculata]|uniref:PTS glucose transporter subunit IIA n=1 Tax=Enterobacteriaceae endosymbiont of Macroplea appendiculata TaxID=2675790 RepID=UPI0014491A64|nr:PTS glucose transporter subunit IIA [Enterobacteriaceae endosymbiont of Macroplea appendiculata]QJC31003.1 PTS glucose transporter subunit IIA [Enterobacteriaceae endosymbiont of Macroplea appendiculata]
MIIFTNFFKKKQTQIKNNYIKIFAPISGTIENIENVPDTVFSDKIIGDGIAINPTSNILVSPVDGIIGKIFDTNHAFSILIDNDIELFVHFGIDTVNLQGKGFKRIFSTCKTNNVKKGEPIIELDLDFLRKNAKSILTPVVISNIEDIKKIDKYTNQVRAGIDPILKIYK